MASLGEPDELAIKYGLSPEAIVKAVQKSFKERRSAMLLRNKNAMVTGGSRIGRSICLALAKNGANVAFTYFQDEKSAHALKEEILALV